MKTILRVLVILIIVAAGGAAGYWLLIRGHAAEVYRLLGIERGETGGPIRVSGNIEATEVQIAFKIPGRVERREFDEGQTVKQGATVALLDTADLQSNVALRQAEVQTAEAALAELLAGSRVEEIASAEAAWKKAAHVLADLEAGSRPQEIASAEAGVKAAAADVERLRADYRRATLLYQRKTITDEEFESARAAYEVAIQRHRQSEEQLSLTREGPRKEQIEEARSALEQAKAQYDLVKAGPRKEEIQQGRTRLEQARAALRAAEVQLSYAIVYSPLSGVVLSKNIEPGEYVAPGTAVVTIADLVNVWVRAYIDEGDKGRVKLDQVAWVTTDAYPNKKYKGRVSFISSEAEFTPKNVQTQKERVKLVYRIKIDITNQNNELSPGMPADAVIETGARDEGRGTRDRKSEIRSPFARVASSAIPFPPSLAPRPPPL